MNVAVIGANGFIGRHLVMRLAALPGVKVFAFDISDNTTFDKNIVYKNGAIISHHYFFKQTPKN